MTSLSDSKNNGHVKLWTLLLTTTANNNKKRHICSNVNPETTTVQDLFQTAQQVFGGTVIALQRARGQALNSSDKSLIEAGMASQDRIEVVLGGGTGNREMAAAPTGTEKGKQSSKTKNNPAKKRARRTNDDDGGDDEEFSATGITGDESATKAASATDRRPKRHAAAQASASFAETIRQQDEIMALGSKPKKRPASSVNKTSPSKRMSTSNSKAFRTTAGRRLHDGSTIAATAPRRRRTNPGNPEDASVALVNAATAKTNQGRLMRAGWKQAVESAVEQNKAVARLAAIAAGKYTIHLQSDNNKFSIRFSKGVQGRGEFQDDAVDALSKTVLQALVESIHPVNPEALRPENLALLSPRVLWSIVYHYQNENNSAPVGASVDIMQALCSICPQLDWAFLRRRKEQLSAKALENLRQKREEQGHHGTDWQAAAEAIESVEQAMEEMGTFAEESNGSDHATYKPSQEKFDIITPDETDTDELVECMREASCNTNGHTLNYQELARGLVAIGIHNWRKLANVVEPEQIVAHLKQEFSEAADLLTAAMVQDWMEQAQLRTLEEIMMEICDGDDDSIEMLRQHANSGTPKDLAAWDGITSALRSVLLSQQQEALVPDEDKLSVWCNRARQVLDQFEWINQFATPIEGGA